MKSTGVVRRVDQLGRIVLPKELRDTFGIAEKTPLAIFVDGDDIILRKYGNSCVFCGEEAEGFSFFNKLLCKKCAHKIAIRLQSEPDVRRLVDIGGTDHDNH